MILVDSNILVYSFNRSVPKKRTQARQYLQNNAGELALAHQNILETIRVLTHAKFQNPVSTQEALRAVEALVSGFRVITPNDTTRHVALALIEKHGINGNQVFDAYLAATALTNEIHAIATDNVKDFAFFESLSVISPFEN